MSRDGKTTILVVDDESSVRTVVRIVLKRHGYDVIEADSAATALAIWKLNAPVVDLVLTDVMMPGKSGKELVDELRNSRPGIKVVFTSGHDLEGGEIPASVKREIFMSKPYSPDALLRIVRETLGKPLDKPPGR